MAVQPETKTKGGKHLGTGGSLCGFGALLRNATTDVNKPTCVVVSLLLRQGYRMRSK